MQKGKIKYVTVLLSNPGQKTAAKITWMSKFLDTDHRFSNPPPRPPSASAYLSLEAQHQKMDPSAKRTEKEESG